MGSEFVSGKISVSVTSAYLGQRPITQYGGYFPEEGGGTPSYCDKLVSVCDKLINGILSLLQSESHLVKLVQAYTALYLRYSRTGYGDVKWCLNSAYC